MSALAPSKASKKNQKRAEKRARERAQKLKEDGVIDRLIQENDGPVDEIKEKQDPVGKLKAQLQDAKDNKDHKLAAKLRKDLWMMQDQMAGCIPPGEIAEHEEEPTPAIAEDENTPEKQSEKKLRGLKKKLQQIEKLKSKQDEGEVLEDLQIAKIQSEEVVLKEIDELQERLEQVGVTLDS
ncbi:caldesmon-like [Dendronephthya gigantea]|uniref:caldesmon-like n=1 Tax=Dendronephthya gigantea TaxID=151771 RepID=UPI001069377B|nr:caldesmon-like [Dendronephthya gigantea]